MKRAFELNTDEIKIKRNPFVRWMLITVGFGLVAIGVLGMFLPILPTTIFFILAAWCFARSSEKFYHWLHYNRCFGKYLRTYRSGEGMTLISKIISLLILWTGILLSAVIATENVYVRVLLIMIAVGVTWHILAIKTADIRNHQLKN